VKIGKSRKLIDPGEEVVLKLKEFLEKNPSIEKTLEKNKNHEFFVSDLTPRFQEIAEKWLGQKIKLNLSR
jgi:glutamate racemase